MNKFNASPRISVIIPTFNRAALLRESLDSLSRQALAREDFEVVVIDDGSTDSTPVACREMKTRMNLRSFRIQNSGISAAKNLGIFTATGPIVLFFDDDDLADPNLLAEHLRVHAEQPDQNVAVLGYTTWAPALKLTEVMHYVTDVGNYLFAYNQFQDGQTLGYKEFWGGRTSCKRSLLVQHGIFNQNFTFGSEDIELGFRLSRFGLRVIFNSKAKQYMNRPVTYDEFCRRREKQGRSQRIFGRLHADYEIQEYCNILNAANKWQNIAPLLNSKIQRVHEIESQPLPNASDEDRSVLLHELHSLYRWTFDAFAIKGVAAIADPYHTPIEKDFPPASVPTFARF